MPPSIHQRTHSLFLHYLPLLDNQVKFLVAFLMICNLFCLVFWDAVNRCYLYRAKVQAFALQ
jgi:hypothetical protein